MSENKTKGIALVRSSRADLDALASGIRQDFEGARVAGQTMVARLAAVGDKLTRAKALVLHGEWEDWVTEHCDFSLRSAQLYMRLAELPKSARVALSTIQEGLDKLAPPPPEPIRELRPITVSEFDGYIQPQGPENSLLRTAHRVKGNNDARLNRAYDDFGKALEKLWRTVNRTCLGHSLAGRALFPEYKAMNDASALLYECLGILCFDEPQVTDRAELLAAAKRLTQDLQAYKDATKKKRSA